MTRQGHAPYVALEKTHLGSALDQAVLRAKRRVRIGADPDYDLVYENFDVLHYLLQAPYLLDDPKVDVVRHFLESGEEQRLSPHPDFSMSEYVRRYPKKASGDRVRSPFLVWLKKGKAQGDIADPAPKFAEMAEVLGLPPAYMVDLVAERRRDLQQRLRTGTLGEMFARATEIEPLIGDVWTEISDPKLLPLSQEKVVDEITAIYRAQRAARFRRARIVLVINRARWGGGRRIEGHLAHALDRHIDPAEIVIVYTDDSTSGPMGRYPAGVREIDFARISQSLSGESAQHALVMFLRSFQADAIVNINSKMLYQAIRSYGRSLAVSERLFLVFFCNEQTALGTWRGWSLRYFYRTFDYVTGIITDSEYLARQLGDAYQLDEEARARVHVFHAPVEPTLPVFPNPPVRPGRRPQVFWAGRWDRQKRIDLFWEVTRLMPEVDFRMWGEPVMGGSARQMSTNVSVEGRYGHISEIPLHDADVWLYTSAWDGVPSLLLEVAMTGIPIVGSLVGGTSEVLTSEDGWPVVPEAGAADYVKALRDVLAAPEASRRRALALRERLLSQRTESKFARQAAKVLLVDPRRGEDAP